MTIPRVKSSGWATNEKLTSAQITQVDQHTSWALDNRSGQTDTLALTSGSPALGIVGSAMEGSVTERTANMYSLGTVNW